jgi:hypothetical protein
VEHELRSGRMVALDVEGFPIMRDWFLVYRQGKRLSPSALSFRDFVLEQGAQMEAGVRGVKAASKASSKAPVNGMTAKVC